MSFLGQRTLHGSLVRLPKPSVFQHCNWTPIAGKLHSMEDALSMDTALHGSNFPCYLLWPWRRASSFCMLESQTRRYVGDAVVQLVRRWLSGRLDRGLRHFYDGFTEKSACGGWYSLLGPHGLSASRRRRIQRSCSVLAR